VRRARTTGVINVYGHGFVQGEFALWVAKIPFTLPDRADVRQNRAVASQRTPLA